MFFVCAMNVLNVSVLWGEVQNYYLCQIIITNTNRWSDRDRSRDLSWIRYGKRNLQCRYPGTGFGDDRVWIVRSVWTGTWVRRGRRKWAIIPDGKKIYLIQENILKKISKKMILSPKFSPFVKSVSISSVWMFTDCQHRCTKNLPGLPRAQVSDRHRLTKKRA